MAPPVSLRSQVAKRAGHRCAYCGLAQEGQAATFHLDHIVPIFARGKTVLDNLALACINCSLRKGARQTATDPQTGRSARLFHPRQQKWNHHFRWAEEKIIAITAVGRGTISALGLNSGENEIIRSFERILGRHPPPGHL